MPAKKMLLPGIDYFQLLIDHHTRRLGGSGHEARLAVYLEGSPGEEEIRRQISENATCRRLARVRVTKHKGVGFPALYFIDDPGDIPVSFHREPGNNLPERYLQVPVDVYGKPPMHLQVIYFGNGHCCLLFSFHHILFDFAGVQSFLKSFAGMGEMPLLPGPRIQAPFGRRFRNFFRAVSFTFREANWRMEVPERYLPAVKKHSIVYRERIFSNEESEAIDHRAMETGAGLNPGMFQLACVCRAVYDVVLGRQSGSGFIWIPVPVNVRRKGSPGAVLLNGLTFLFYKIYPKDLKSAEQTVATIRKQMSDQMRRDLPQAFLDFADGYRYMPMFFYYPMLQLPSLGKLSTFNFSALGDTFEGLETLLGKKVTDVRNFPSNSIAPGITFLFYRFRGQLRLMTSWVEGQFSAEEQAKVVDEIAGIITGKQV